MLKIALKINQIMFVLYQKKEEITTEGGLNIKKKKNYLQKIIKKLKKKKIRVSLFIEPKNKDIKFQKNWCRLCRIHTGKYCNFLMTKKN